MGFENLVFSVFEFIHGLIETPKFKKTVKKFLDELIYFLVLYMQITEEQVGFVFRCFFFFSLLPLVYIALTFPSTGSFQILGSLTKQ